MNTKRFIEKRPTRIVQKLLTMSPPTLLGRIITVKSVQKVLTNNLYT